MRVKVKPTKPRTRQIELDFIRGIAILMVLDFHAPITVLLAPAKLLGFANFGWSGVDIFFVLSGFLVGGLLVKEWQVFGRIDSRRFLIRRGFKIWPQYYVFLFANLLTGHRTLRQLWGNLLNIQNYVGGIAHTWTLAVEEHAYLLLVGLLALAARKGASVKHLLYGTGTLAIAVVVWRFTLAAHGVNGSMRTDTRVDGILYGLMLAIVYHYSPEVFRRLQRRRAVWFSVLAAALVYFRFASINAWWQAPLAWAFADAMGVALLLLLYWHEEGRVRSAPYRFVAWIGLYSYGIYLWHVSILALVSSASRHLPPGLKVLWDLTAPLLLAVGLGVLTTRAVEFPTLKLRDRLFARRVSSAVG